MYYIYIRDYRMNDSTALRKQFVIDSTGIVKG